MRNPSRGRLGSILLLVFYLSFSQCSFVFWRLLGPGWQVSHVWMHIVLVVGFLRVLGNLVPTFEMLLNECYA